MQVIWPKPDRLIFGAHSVVTSAREFLTDSAGGSSRGAVPGKNCIPPGRLTIAPLIGTKDPQVEKKRTFVLMFEKDFLQSGDKTTTKRNKIVWKWIRFPEGAKGGFQGGLVSS